MPVELARSAIEDPLRRELNWQLDGNAGFMLADDPANRDLELISNCWLP